MDDKRIFRNVKSLVKAECANYDRGKCLETDEKCHIINPRYKTVHDGAIDCDYFLERVLPWDWELADLISYALWVDDDSDSSKAPNPRRCGDCGKLFVPGSESSRQIYCKHCSESRKKRNTRKRVRNFRMKNSIE